MTECLKYPWQQQQWQHLLARKAADNLPHALLLSGQTGLGKNDFAQALAKLLLCEQSESKACDHCRGCKLIQANNHPDLFLLQPEEKSKVIKIEQIRAVIKSINQKSHQGGYQVVIISPADSMNISAGNALLKILEEPPGKVVMMLVTNKPLALTATIRSRCQKINFYPPSQQEGLVWLQQQDINSNNPELLLSLAENAPLKALTLADKNNLEQRDELFKNFMELIENKIDPLTFAKSCMTMDLTIILPYLQNWLADILRCKLQITNKFMVNTDKIAILQNTTPQIPTTKLLQLLEQITSVQKNLTNNLNAQLVLESLAMEINNAS